MAPRARRDLADRTGARGSWPRRRPSTFAFPRRSTRWTRCRGGPTARRRHPAHVRARCAARRVAATARHALAGDADDPLDTASGATGSIGRAAASLQGTDDAVGTGPGADSSGGRTHGGRRCGARGRRLPVRELPNASTLENKAGSSGRLALADEEVRGRRRRCAGVSHAVPGTLAQLDVSEDALGALQRLVTRTGNQAGRGRHGSHPGARLPLRWARLSPPSWPAWRCPGPTSPSRSAPSGRNQMIGRPLVLADRRTVRAGHARRRSRRVRLHRAPRWQHPRCTECLRRRALARHAGVGGGAGGVVGRHHDGVRRGRRRVGGVPRCRSAAAWHRLALHQVIVVTRTCHGWPPTRTSIGGRRAWARRRQPGCAARRRRAGGQSWPACWLARESDTAGARPGTARTNTD